MPHIAFTNLDALWLASLRDQVNSGEVMVVGNENANAIMARLLRIAENLQRLDEANAVLANNLTYAQGVADAEARMRQRSNVLSNPEGEDEVGRTVLEQINRRVAEGNVKRLALGERALEDKPHKFNAPVRRSQVANGKPKAPAVSLDLSFLDDL